MRLKRQTWMWVSAAVVTAALVAAVAAWGGGGPSVPTAEPTAATSQPSTVPVTEPPSAGDATSSPEPGAGGPPITDGIWVIGKDAPAGRYQTAADVSKACYWWIYKSGVAPEQILYNVIANGSPDAGRPIVRLEVGQTFQVWSCGTWRPIVEPTTQPTTESPVSEAPRSSSPGTK